jgi:hypothetical protein
MSAANLVLVRRFFDEMGNERKLDIAVEGGRG